MPRTQVLVPQALQALDRLKVETASELGIPNYTGYLGDVPSKYNGAVGGNMVRKMIRLAESQLVGATSPTAITGPAGATAGGRAGAAAGAPAGAAAGPAGGAAGLTGAAPGPAGAVAGFAGGGAAGAPGAR